LQEQIILDYNLSHELQSSEPALIMSLQVPSAFFETYYPLLDICMESGFSDPKYFNKSSSLTKQVLLFLGYDFQ